MSSKYVRKQVEFKNPLSQAFGAVLKRRRQDVKVTSIENLAERLGIGLSTYRFIEAGTLGAPSYCSLGLVKALGMEWLPTVTIVGIIDVLDQQKRDVNKMRILANQLKEAEPFLGWIVDEINSTWDAIERRKEVSLSEDFIEKLYYFLTTPMAPDEKITDEAEIWGKRLVTETPPIFLDSLEEFIEQLRRFPPSISVEGIANWESKNRNRTRLMYGIMSDISLLESWTEWDFMGNDNFRGIRIICLDKKDSDIKKTLSKIPEHLLIGNGRDLVKRRIEIKIAEEKQRDEIIHLLRFDTETRDMPDMTLEAFNVSRKKHPSRFIDFKNAWVYELNPVRNNPKHTSISFAFIDDASPKKGGERIHAEACSWNHMWKIKKWFNVNWPNL